jgi:hypothetical protein
VLILVAGEIKAILETGAVLVLASMLQNADAPASQSSAAYYLPMFADHCLLCWPLSIQSIDISF